MSDLRTSIVLDLAGNLESRARRYGQALGDMSSRGQRSLGVLRSSAALAGQGLDALGNRYTALLTGAAGIGAAKMVMDLQRRFTRLGIQAGIADDEVKNLKRSIYEAAQAPDIRVDPGQITSAVEAIVEKTGDLDFARANIRNIGLAIQATGAEGASIGEILAEFQKMDIKDPRQVMEALDILNKQGKMGAFTLQNLAALGPRVITAYTARGRGGVQALKEMGAALQLIRMGTGSSEQAATAFEATMRVFGDPAKLKLMSRLGLQIYDPEKLKAGRRELRPINELMAEIIRKVGGDSVKLQSILGSEEAARAFNHAFSEFLRIGRLDTLEKFMDVVGDGAETTGDSARAARDAAGAMQNLYTAWKKFADDKLAEPIQSVADALNAVGSERTSRAINRIATVGAALGGLVLLRKAYTGFQGLGGMLGRGGALARSGVGLGAGLPVPLPVYVVNSRMSLMPGQYGGGAAGGGAAGAASGAGWLADRGGLLGRWGQGLAASRAGKWLGKGSRLLGKAGGALNVGLAGYDLYDTWSDDDLATTRKVERTGGIAGGFGGGLAGAKLGAMLGTAILPGIGTAIGAAGGGVLGYLSGQWGGEKLAGWFTGRDNAQERAAEKMAEAAENMRLQMKLEVVGGRVSVRDLHAHGVEADVDTGQYMGAY